MTLRLHYLLFAKPYGVLSQFTRPANSRPDTQTLADYIPIPAVYPVGRLDRDSEGLLLLTNDGSLAQRLIHPRYAHPRTYWAQVEGIPTPAALQALADGVIIEGQRTRPAHVQVLDPQPTLPDRHPPIRYRAHIPTTWIELILREGRNRQVRRMTAAVGFPTLRLIRVALGSLTLAGLDWGRYRPLTAAELAGLKQIVGLLK
ncbi:MAG: pseudouridine synthase [Thermostichales cyanobacterium BF4_bins_65]